MPLPSRAARLAIALSLATPSAARAVDCVIADARVEERIARSGELREAANAQVLRDLRTLRDAAVVLKTYEHETECARLLAIVRARLTSPEKAVEASGDTDEAAAEATVQATKPRAPKPN